MKAAKVTVKVAKEPMTRSDRFAPVRCPMLALSRLPVGFCRCDRRHRGLGRYRAHLPLLRYLAAGH